MAPLVAKGLEIKKTARLMLPLVVAVGQVLAESFRVLQVLAAMAPALAMVVVVVDQLQTPRRELVGMEHFQEEAVEEVEVQEAHQVLEAMGLAAMFVFGVGNHGIRNF